MNDIFEKHFKEQGFTEPTLIQKEVYPLLAQGKDVLGLSPTGSGKTLAYALPLLEKVLKGDGPQLLIIAPSQELAAQLADVIRPWGKLLEIKTAAIIGGANVKRQIEKLRKDRPEVIVGTPGRLLNLADEKRLKLHNLEAIVIDEADEMLAQEETGRLPQTCEPCQSRRSAGLFLSHEDARFERTAQVVRHRTDHVRRQKAGSNARSRDALHGRSPAEKTR